MQQTALRTWAIDPAHSSAEFFIRHMMFAKVRGRFGALAGTLHIADGSDIPREINAQIETASIDTRNAERDAHLRSADFLDAEKFAHISFRATGIEPTGGAAFHVHGDLTIHGVTNDVILNAQVAGRGNDPWGNERIGFSATAQIDRRAFGLVWNQALESGGILVGDEVTIDLDIQAIAAASV